MSEPRKTHLFVDGGHAMEDERANAKTVVEDHKSGNAKIDFNAKKTQILFLVRKQLLKYGDESFWINVHCVITLLGLAILMSMVAAVLIITIYACAQSTTEPWFDKGARIVVGDVAYDKMLPKLNPALNRIVLEVSPFQSGSFSAKSLKACAAAVMKYVIKAIAFLMPNYVFED